MRFSRFALFETILGTAAIGWGDAGVTATRLPEADRDIVLVGVRRRNAAAVEAEPGDDIAAAIAAIRDLLEGGRPTLRDVALDLDGIGAFDRLVYERARAIDPGSTATYGEIAVAIGAPGEARAVGQSLGRNPFPIIVPCHRVLAARGGTGGFSGPGGVRTKLAILSIERARTTAEPTLFDAGDWPLEGRRG